MAHFYTKVGHFLKDHISDTKWPALSGISSIAGFEGANHVFTYLPRMFIR